MLVLIQNSHAIAHSKSRGNLKNTFKRREHVRQERVRFLILSLDRYHAKPFRANAVWVEQ
jgi:hypothetical protein